MGVALKKWGGGLFGTVWTVELCKVEMTPNCFLFFFFLFFVFLGLHPWHMEVPRLGVELELQLLAYTIATAMWDPSFIFNLHHSSWQLQILNPLSGARD